ncbi:MAG: hypothetical protein IC227_00695 [Enterococcus lacertideformus]|uniref:Uncharacterized protein n=1 Tax=Enterococcus lacertideformus TaxID=2771493 RepID=A0A931ASU5_9ENTE|nr:hypothetical protein [Enterococcus lacertideformus]
MNQKAKERYGFSETETSAESCYRLIKEMLANQTLVQAVYQEFEALLLSREAVSIKEIIFDEVEFLKSIPIRKLMTTFYLQSVEAPISLEAVKSYQIENFSEKFVLVG